MASQHKVFTPEHLNIVRRAIERVRLQRRLPRTGAQTERLASKALDLFKAGYIRVEALARALREDG